MILREFVSLSLIERCLSTGLAGQIPSHLDGSSFFEQTVAP
ncbi:MAG: hypothetical protein ACTS73_05080 [Arsenophonus sp. NEOnobi-MAG3]